MRIDAPRGLINLCFFLCFFPNARIIPGITAEVQPAAAIVAFFVLLICGVRRGRVSMAAGALSLLLVCYTVVSVFRGVPALGAVLDLTAYLAPLTIFLALRQNIRLLAPKFFVAATVIHFFVGTLQAAGVMPFRHEIASVIPRFDSVYASGGAAFLTSEPSYGAQILALIVATDMLLFWRGKLSGLSCIAIALVSVVMLVENRSSTAMVLMGAYGAVLLLFYGPRWFRRHPLSASAGLIAVIAGLCSIVSYINSGAADDQRYAETIMLLESMPLDQLTSYRGLGLLAEARLISDIVGYKAMFDWYGVGHGVDSYAIDGNKIYEVVDLPSGDCKVLAGLKDCQSKPQSYGAQIALDAGAAGLCLLLYVAVLAALAAKSPRSTSGTACRGVKCGIISVALLLLFLDGTTAMPAPWVMLAEASVLASDRPPD